MSIEQFTTYVTRQAESEPDETRRCAYENARALLTVYGHRSKASIRRMLAARVRELARQVRRASKTQRETLTEQAWTYACLRDVLDGKIAVSLQADAKKQLSLWGENDA